jgi:hypothetical protein
MCPYRRLSLPSVAVLIGIWCIAASPARAAEIIQTITFAPFNGNGGIAGSLINEFDPASGTLQSVSINGSVTATFSNASTGEDNAFYDFFWTGSGSTSHSVEPSRPGNGSVMGLISSDDTSPAALANFTGTQKVTSEVTAVNESNDGASLASTFGPMTVTYNYTPAAVPESPSIALLSVGLLGLGWTLRQRRSAR